MMSGVLVPFTAGFEEIECLAVVDILRRAGIEVCLASLDGKAVTGRSAITVMPDAALADVMGEIWEMVVLPGGMPNARLLRDDVNVRAVVERLHAEGKIVAAICAAPTALATYGVTAGRRVTSSPSFQDEMEELAPSSIYTDEAVVEDGQLITSRGPGTAISFALRLVGRLCGSDKAAEIRQSILA